jgi:phage gp45-like
MVYSTLPSIEGKDVNITLGDVVVIEKNSDDTTTPNRISYNGSTKLNVDAVAPKLADADTDTLDAVVKDTDLSNGFSVDVKLTETLKQATPSVDELNKYFTITEGNGKTDITSIQTATFNSTTKTLTLDLNNTTTIGDVSISYKSGYLTDSAGNLVPEFSGRKIFDDTTKASIDKVDVDFSTLKKGQVTFNELIKTDSLSGITFTGSFGGEARVISNVQVLESDELKTTLTFETDKEIGDGFSLTAQNMVDFGENTQDVVQSGTFSAGTLGTTITPLKWNLISIPNGKLTTSKKMTATGTVQTIWSYENSTWTQSPKTLVAGKGYWVKGAVNTDDFNTTETTGYDSVIDIDSATIISKNSSSEWTLLGTNANLSWADAYKQVQEGCNSVSVFAYDVANNSWNTTSNIPANSGIWAKQENCEK